MAVVCTVSAGVSRARGRCSCAAAPPSQAAGRGSEHPRRGAGRSAIGCAQGVARRASLCRRSHASSALCRDRGASRDAAAGADRVARPPAPRRRFLPQLSGHRCRHELLADPPSSDGDECVTDVRIFVGSGAWISVGGVHHRSVSRREHRSHSDGATPDHPVKTRGSNGDDEITAGVAKFALPDGTRGFVSRPTYRMRGTT